MGKWYLVLKTGDVYIKLSGAYKLVKWLIPINYIYL